MTEQKEQRSLEEDYKSVYKEFQELIRQIEVTTSRCGQVEDLFSPELLGLRFKFREVCEKLICGRPEQFGRPIREKLWRYAFYEVIGRARRFVKDNRWEPLPKAYVTQHLHHGIGYLSMLLIKLGDAQDFERLNFPFCPNSVDPILNKEIEEEKPESLPEPEKWLVELLYMIHINIGDLYRYLTDIYVKESVSEAEDYFGRAKEFYSQAYLLHPQSGLAMNQIGNLSVKINYGIDTTYYMLHSMLSTIPYEGAPHNLRNHLSSCLVTFARLPATYDAKPIEIFSNNFLTQIHNFLYETLNMNNFGKNISDVIVNFQERLATYDPDLDERVLFRIACICVYTSWQLQAQNATSISLSVAFATAMFSQILTRVGSILEQHGHLKKILPSRQTSPPPLTLNGHDGNVEDRVTVTSEDGSIASNLASLALEKDDFEEEAEENHILKPKQACAARRRRRRRVFKHMMHSTSTEESGSDEDNFGDEGGDSDNEDSDDSDASWSQESDSEQSDSECTGDRSSVADHHVQNGNFPPKNRAFASSSSCNSRSDTSAASDRAQNLYNIDSGIKSEYEKTSEASGKEESKDGCNGFGTAKLAPDQLTIGLNDLEKCRSQLEPLLVALTPFIRWIQISPGIKDAFAANCGKEYVNSLCSMLNLLLSEDWGDLFDGVSEETRKDWQALTDGKSYDDQLFNCQLPEDRSLMGIAMNDAWIQTLDTNKVCGINDMLVSRMGRFVNFGHWLVQTKCFWIAYDAEKKEFKYQSPRAKTSGGDNEKIKRLMDLDPGSDALTRAYKAAAHVETNGGKRRGRNDKGRDRRRGRRRGSEQTRSKDAASVVFIVVDLPAVLYYLRNVQKIANKRRFVVVFPRPVWKAVDEMKDSQGFEAKEAQRASEWIKMCTVKGHRGVRCLRDHEKIPLECEYPKKMDKVSREFFLMMETCKYLLTHDGNDKSASRTFFGDMRDKFRVIFLSGHDDILNRESSDFSVIGMARMVGTFVDLVSGYPPQSKRRKWRKSKSNG